MGLEYWLASTREERPHDCETCAVCAFEVGLRCQKYVLELIDMSGVLDNLSQGQSLNVRRRRLPLQHLGHDLARAK